MTDLVARLREAVGEANVLTGAAIPEEYTHDEALTGNAVVPLAVVRPADAPEVVGGLASSSVLRRARDRARFGYGLLGRVHPAAPTASCARSIACSASSRSTSTTTVAVVEAGVTLDQLDEAVAPLGLVYPVYPGETSASLGGNVATNAGGMRAVKYGVTRHQVLGLERRARDRRGDPHRRQVRQGDDRLRPDATDHRFGRHARRSSPKRS